MFSEVICGLDDCDGVQLVVSLGDSTALVTQLHLLHLVLGGGLKSLKIKSMDPMIQIRKFSSSNQTERVSSNLLLGILSVIP